ncbi:uncharacterized protein LOC104653401 [Saimiri boliviensis]|uniref:uncharacterized protein LOC104653401 n=1 Tax=Saimiri boliviensis TaxID=27679 RepID=UPI003D779964
MAASMPRGLLVGWVTRVHPVSCFLWAPVADAGIHKNRSGLPRSWLSDSTGERMNKEEAAACEASNPCSPLKLGHVGPSEPEEPTPDCQQTIDVLHAARPDLTDVPLRNPEEVLYTDGSSFMVDRVKALQSVQSQVHLLIGEIQLTPVDLTDQPVRPFQPKDEVLVKRFTASGLTPSWKGPYTVILVTPMAIKVNGLTAWIHHSHVKTAPRTQNERWSHFQQTL